MNKNDFALGKTNLLLIGAALLFIIFGFICMAWGPSSSLDHGFEPDIFNPIRINVAPMIVLFGFIVGVVGILFPQKDREELDKDLI